MEKLPCFGVISYDYGNSSSKINDDEICVATPSLFFHTRIQGRQPDMLMLLTRVATSTKSAFDRSSLTKPKIKLFFKKNKKCYFLLLSSFGLCVFSFLLFILAFGYLGRA